MDGGLDLKQLLFTAQGRLARGGFWKGVLILIVLTVIGATAVGLFGALLPHETGADGAYHVEGLAAVPVILISFVTIGISIWGGLCLAIKRFHDRDKSGWWVLIQFVPIIGPIWYFIETGFLPGTPGPNSFGPDPLGAPPLPHSPAIA